MSKSIIKSTSTSFESVKANVKAYVESLGNRRNHFDNISLVVDSRWDRINNLLSKVSFERYMPIRVFIMFKTESTTEFKLVKFSPVFDKSEYLLFAIYITLLRLLQ